VFHFVNQVQINLLRALTNAKGKERTVETFCLQALVIPEAVQEEQRLDGITCFISNMTSERCSAQEVVAYYRGKNKVEEAFHEIKAHLNLRPMHLTRSQRVKAHVAVCMMAYFLLNDIEQRLKAKGLKVSSPMALRELKKCQLSRIEVKGNQKVELKVTEPNDIQLELLEAMDCQEVVGKKFIKKVLKEAQNI
jgi:transposase